MKIIRIRGNDLTKNTFKVNGMQHVTPNDYAHDEWNTLMQALRIRRIDASHHGFIYNFPLAFGE